MEELNDDEIQKRFDAQARLNPRELEELAATNADARLYRLLYEGLAREPGLHLSPGFSRRVAAGISAEQKKAATVKAYAIAALCLLATLVVAFALINSFNQSHFVRTVYLLAGLKWKFLFAAASYGLVQLADHLLIRRRLFA